MESKKYYQDPSIDIDGIHHLLSLDDNFNHRLNPLKIHLEHYLYSICFKKPKQLCVTTKSLFKHLRGSGNIPHNQVYYTAAMDPIHISENGKSLFTR